MPARRISQVNGGVVSWKQLSVMVAAVALLMAINTTVMIPVLTVSLEPFVANRIKTRSIHVDSVRQGEFDLILKRLDAEDKAIEIRLGKIELTTDELLKAIERLSE